MFRETCGKTKDLGIRHQLQTMEGLWPICLVCSMFYTHISYRTAHGPACKKKGKKVSHARGIMWKTYTNFTTVENKTSVSLAAQVTILWKELMTVLKLKASGDIPFLWSLRQVPCGMAQKNPSHFSTQIGPQSDEYTFVHPTVETNSENK